jgi:hypothetical protein
MTWIQALQNVSWFFGQVKPVLESAAIVAGGVALLKWFTERKDRATDVLLKLEEHFNEVGVRAGRFLVEDGDHCESVAKTLNSQRRPKEMTEDQKNLDNLLRFYVVVCAVRQAGQVSDRALSTCYRFWLSHYYLNKREAFRSYINDSFPTLRDWLIGDTPAVRRGTSRLPWRVKPAFFTPGHFWKASAFSLDPLTLDPARDKRN